MPKRKRAQDAPSPSNEQNVNSSNTPKAPNAFSIPIEGQKPIQCQRHPNTNSDPKPTLIFTHGAGGGLTAPAIQDFATAFSSTSNLVTFQGNIKLKSRVSSFHKVIAHEACRPALGGRSMGARAACLAAQETKSDDQIDNALVLVSFPLVGAKKRDSRAQILLDLPEEMDVLFISGTEDTMCDLEHLSTVVNEMKARSWIVECEGADHGMSLPRQKAGSQPMRVRTGEIAAQWLRRRDGGKRFLLLRWDDEKQVVETEGWNEGVSEDEGQAESPG